MPFGYTGYKAYEILLMGEFYAFFGWFLMRAVREWRLSRMRKEYERMQSPGRHERPASPGEGWKPGVRYGAKFFTGPASMECWIGSMIGILWILPLQERMPEAAVFFLTLALMILMTLVLGYTGSRLLRRPRWRRRPAQPMPFSAGYTVLAGLAGFEAAWQLQPHLEHLLGQLPLPLDWFLLMVFYIPFVYELLDAVLGIGPGKLVRRAEETAEHAREAAEARAVQSGRVAPGRSEKYRRMQ